LTFIILSNKLWIRNQKKGDVNDEYALITKRIIFLQLL